MTTHFRAARRPGSPDKHNVARRLEADRDLVRAVAARLVGDADADDIVQETFLRALTSPPLDTRGPLRPWLVTVARRLGIDWLRKRGRLELPVETESADHEPPPVALTDLLGGLGRLTRGEIVVLLLRDAMDLSVDEVAAVLETSPGSVRVLHHRARAKAAGDPTPDLAGIEALDHFLLWLLARAAAGLPGDTATSASDLLLTAGVLTAQARLLDGIVAVSAGHPQVEARARLSRGVARRTLDPSGALVDLQAARDLGADPSPTGARIAELLYLLGHHEPARTAAQEVIERDDAPALLPKMHGLLSSLCMAGGDLEGARAHVELARAGGESVEAAMAAGLELLITCRYVDAMAELLAALALCRHRGGHQEPSILNNLGLACMELQRFEEATAWFSEVLPLLRQRGDPGRESTVLGNLALIDRHQGRLSEAAVGLERALTLAQATNRLVYVELWRMNLGVLELLRGRPRRARSLLERAHAGLVGLGDQADGTIASLWLGVCDLQLEGDAAPLAALKERAHIHGPGVLTAVDLLLALAHLQEPERREQARVHAERAEGDNLVRAAAQVVLAAVEAADRETADRR